MNFYDKDMPEHKGGGKGERAAIFRNKCVQEYPEVLRTWVQTDKGNWYWLDEFEGYVPPIDMNQPMEWKNYTASYDVDGNQVS